MHGVAEYSASILYPTDVLSGHSWAHIRASVAAIVPAVQERRQKPCNAIALIAFIKDTTVVYHKTPAGSCKG